MSSVDVRMRKARRLASCSSGIVQSGIDTYLVLSENKARHYRVTTRGGGEVCDCPDFQYRKEVCKHVLAVKVWMEGERLPSQKYSPINTPAFFDSRPVLTDKKTGVSSKAAEALSGRSPPMSPPALPASPSPGQPAPQNDRPLTSQPQPKQAATAATAPAPHTASPVTSRVGGAGAKATLTTDRIAKGVSIALGGGIVGNADGSYFVPSESKPGTFYEVRRVSEAWACSCPDFQYRRIESCKHIVGVLQGLIQGYIETKPTNPEGDTPVCPKCGSSDFVVDNGHTKKGGKQLMHCKGCNKYFRKPALVRKARFEPKTVVAVLDLYFTACSQREASDWIFRNLGIKVSHQTVGRWVKKWVPVLEKFIDMLVPKLSGVWHVDEMEVKVRGGFTLGRAPGMYNFRWNTMDRGTKYFLATQLTTTRKEKDSANMMKKAQAAAKEDPQAIVSDKHGTYPGGIAQAFQLSHNPPVHVRVLGGAGQRRGNQAIERLNNTVRARSKTMRGLKSPESPVPTGEVIYYDHVRSHMSLEGKTPGERAGLGDYAAGPNKLLSLFTNAIGFQGYMDRSFPATRW